MIFGINIRCIPFSITFGPFSPCEDVFSVCFLFSERGKKKMSELVGQFGGRQKFSIKLSGRGGGGSKLGRVGGTLKTCFKARMTESFFFFLQILSLA